MQTLLQTTSIQYFGRDSRMQSSNATGMGVRLEHKQFYDMERLAAADRTCSLLGQWHVGPPRNHILVAPHAAVI